VIRVPASIARAVRAAGGRVTFARFMELALTEPESGYYSRGEPLLGPHGDFTTAPHKVPAFNRAVSQVVAQVVDAMPVGLVLVADVGAGEGDLAAGMLAAWQSERPDLRERVVYRTVDLSGPLRTRQERALSAATEAGWDAAACADFPHPLSWPAGAAPASAVVVGNELLDALPVHRVDVRGAAPREAWARLPESEVVTFEEEWGDVSVEAAAEFESLFGARDPWPVRPLTRDGTVELRPAVRSLLVGWVTAYPDICVITVDYGDRMAGPGVAGRLHGRTLRGYLHHQTTTDPYQAVGRQDLTADVDFRALQLHGEALGLECVLFAPLAAFLRGMGGLEEAQRLGESATDCLDSDMAATALRALLDDAGLGGEFKIMMQVGEGASERGDRPDEEVAT
jgi:SAM-dependent MidA family methyltransferase